MIIVIRQYYGCEDQTFATYLMGTYESETDARNAIADQLARFKTEWEEEGGEGWECDATEDELYDGSCWDHTGAYKWIVFDTDKPREVWY